MTQLKTSSFGARQQPLTHFITPCIVFGAYLSLYYKEMLTFTKHLVLLIPFIEFLFVDLLLSYFILSLCFFVLLTLSIHIVIFVLFLSLIKGKIKKVPRYQKSFKIQSENRRHRGIIHFHTHTHTTAHSLRQAHKPLPSDMMRSHIFLIDLFF